MNEIYRSPYLNLLRNRIDICQVPFSDRGSRLLVFQEPGLSRLFVKLAERLTAIEPGLETYLRRPPFIRDLVLIDEKGEPLEFDVVTQPHILYLNTRLGDFGLVFQDHRTLAVGIPPNTYAGIRFHVSPQYWKETAKGGEFKSVRNLAYTTNGEQLTNRIIPEAGGYIVEFIIQSGEDSAITITIGSHSPEEMTVLPFSISAAAAEERWNSWFRRVPLVAERYSRTYAYAWWIMAHNLINPLGSIAYESMMPSKIKYVGLWLWDSALHALAYRHLDPELARNQIRVMLANQLPNGMLPDAVYDEGVIAEIEHPFRAQVTKPPIIAWAALKLHETEPDPLFLEEIYIPLVRWNSWWYSMNDDDADGLVQYTHPYSSGLDDSPLWDYGMPVESPDINTYLFVQMRSLAQIAETLGMEYEAAMWRRRATAVVHRMVEDFWDEQAGLFWTLHNEKPVKIVTPFNLYPLWTGQLPAAINDRLIQHLVDPAEFGGRFVIPTVARNDPHYDPGTMWRGPVWANINYFFIEALQIVGRNDLAIELRQKTLELIMQHSGIHEYYHAETGEPPAAAANIFGWTAAVFIDLAIQASRESDQS
jgi:putative isomerase